MASRPRGVAGPATAGRYAPARPPDAARAARGRRRAHLARSRAPRRARARRARRRPRSTRARGAAQPAACGASPPPCGASPRPARREGGGRGGRAGGRRRTAAAAAAARPRPPAAADARPGPPAPRPPPQAACLHAPHLLALLLLGFDLLKGICGGARRAGRGVSGPAPPRAAWGPPWGVPAGCGRRGGPARPGRPDRAHPAPRPRAHSLSSSFVVASLASPPHIVSITQMSSSEAPVASFIISSTRRGATAPAPPGAALRPVWAMSGGWRLAFTAARRGLRGLHRPDQPRAAGEC